MISIIIPVYKVEEFLDRCIKSVLNQSYTNWEMILIDDGSPDKCPEMCDAYAAKDTRIKVIHQENQGLSNARNAGMRVMSGDILLFLDSDDWLPEMALENVIYNWTDHTDMCFYDYFDVYEGKEPIRRRCIRDSYVDFQSNKVYTLEWLERAINYLCPKEYYSTVFASVWAVAYCIEGIKKYNLLFPEYTQLMEDRAFVLKCLSVFKQIYYVSTPIYCYFHNGNSLTHTSYSENIYNTLQIFERLCCYVDQIEQETEEKKRAVQSHFYFSVIYTLTWRTAFNKERQYKDKSHQYCTLKAQMILNNNTSDFPFPYRLIIKLCANNRVGILEFLIRARQKLIRY